MKNEGYQLSELCKKHGISVEEFKKQFEDNKEKFALQAQNRYIVNQGGILPFSSSI